VKKFVCHHPWTHFEVNNPNGDVTMCCDNNTVLGNVNDSSVEEIWNGEKYQDIRKSMRNQGAHAICPHTCPVMAGFKRWQEMDWFDELPAESQVKKNALLNKSEFDGGKLELSSKPRWMRFCYSYACNLDCYHCYQREDAKINRSLPDKFIQEIYKHAENYQYLYFFGGEPFMYKPVTKMMADIQTPSECRYCLITNATLLTDSVMEMLETKNIGIFAISLDAASERSFDILRVRGRNAHWNEVLKNVEKVAALKKKKGFVFSMSMTVNSVNAHEIEQFVDLSLSYDAEPEVLLVATPDESMRFHREFLAFTTEQFDDMESQIERSIIKVRERQFAEAEAALVHLRNCLRAHRRTENGPLRYLMKKNTRKLFRMFPASFQRQIKAAIGSARLQ